MSDPSHSETTLAHTGHSAPRACVFLDRDGTINRDAGYINHPKRLELIPEAAPAIRRLNQAGVLAIVISNQAGVARGIFTEEVLWETHDRLARLLAEGGARLDAAYYAPHHPDAKDPRYRDDSDQLRKPGVGMARRAQGEWPIDMSRAFMVGDKPADIGFAHGISIPGVLVKTGYGLGEVTYRRAQWTDQPDHIAEHLGEAVDWILSQLGKLTGEQKHSS